MLGIIVLLLLSFALAFFCYGKDFDVIGTLPNKKRLVYFFIGFVLVAVVALLNIFIESAVCSIEWKIKQPIDFLLLRKAVYYYFIAALTEELIFRGFLLYFLADKIKTQRAIVISAVCFGFYHWFSYGMFGKGVVPLLYVFFITGLAGYVWAYAFVKSNTIWLPLGMHFSWNMIQSLFKGTGQYGAILYSQSGKVSLSDINNLFLSLFTGIFPSLIMYFGLYLYFKKKDC